MVNVQAKGKKVVCSSTVDMRVWFGDCFKWAISGLL